MPLCTTIVRTVYSATKDQLKVPFCNAARCQVQVRLASNVTQVTGWTPISVHRLTHLITIDFVISQLVITKTTSLIARNY